LRRAFYWQGFGEINAHCFIHPSADLTAAFDALRVDGMTDVLPSLMPLVAMNPRLGQSANDADMVHSAWDLDQLGANYVEFVKTYKGILEALRKAKKSGLDDESAFLTRTLLIHDFRRLLLRDPELPDVLLPAKWPGQTARMLTKELYQRLLAPSERHLNQHLLLANGDAPPASDLVRRRFEFDLTTFNVV
jgi:phenylacetic acid degradation operon negative regulatory protein